MRIVWFAALGAVLAGAAHAAQAQRVLQQEIAFPILPPSACDALVGRETEFPVSVPDAARFAYGDAPQFEPYAIFSGAETHANVSGIIGLAPSGIEIQSYVKRWPKQLVSKPAALPNKTPPDITPPNKALSDITLPDWAPPEPSDDRPKFGARRPKKNDDTMVLRIIDIGKPAAAPQISAPTINLKILNSDACSQAKPIELLYDVAGYDKQTAGKIRILLFLRDTDAFRAAQEAAKTQTAQFLGELAGADVAYFLSRSQIWTHDPSAKLCASCSRDDDVALKERLLRFLLTLPPGKLKDPASYQRSSLEWSDSVELKKRLDTQSVTKGLLFEPSVDPDRIAEFLCMKSLMHMHTIDPTEPESPYCSREPQKRLEPEPEPEGIWKLELSFGNGASIAFRAIGSVDAGYRGIEIDPESIPSSDRK